jgi:aconitate hydratase 2/2-methylisocitrate dehydratase
MALQARVREGSTLVSTSMRDFPNRIGCDTGAFLAWAEVEALSTRLPRLRTGREYTDACGGPAGIRWQALHP